MQEKEKWYQSNWFTILMLIFVFPVGLFLMWRYNPHWKTWIKIVITIIFTIAFLNGCVNNKNNQTKDNSTTIDQKHQKELEKEKEEQDKKEKELNDKEDALKQREETLKNQEETTKKDTQSADNQHTSDNNSNIDNSHTQSSDSNSNQIDTNDQVVQQQKNSTQHQTNHTQQPNAQAAPTTPQPTKSYPNCKALRQDYPGGVSQGHPAYSSSLDRDGDGTACEAKGN